MGKKIKHSMSPGIKLVVILLLMTLLVGCWDYKEMEKRGYVLGLAIDKATLHPRGGEEKADFLSERDLEKMPLDQGHPKYAYTIQIPVIPQAAIKPEGGGGGGGDAKERTWNLTMVGNSFFEANREFSTRLDFPPFYEHMKVIVISEEVAREGILEPLDSMLRDHEMRRRTRVFITPQEAMRILEVAPRIEDYASVYLEKLPHNADKNSRIAHKTDLGEVSKNIHNNLDFTLPRVIATENEIKDAGVAIFKGTKMIGWLGELDTNYTKWIRDAVLGGVLVVHSPYSPGGLITLEITKAKTEVRPVVEGGKITMNIQVEGTFNIVEDMRRQIENTFDQEFIKEVEKRAKEKLEKEIRDTIEYVQGEFGADIFHFNVVMQRYEPKLWEEIQEDWDDIFPQVEVNIRAKTKVRLTGLIK